MSLKVKSARWLFVGIAGDDLGPDATGGWPILEIDFEDGRRAWTNEEQKFFVYGLPLVYLVGDDFTDVVTTFTHPEHGERITVRCLTDNPVVVRLVTDFVDAVVDGTLTPREVAI